MTNPKIVLVDEPSLGLAPKVVDEVYDQLCKLIGVSKTVKNPIKIIVFI